MLVKGLHGARAVFVRLEFHVGESCVRFVSRESGSPVHNLADRDI